MALALAAAPTFSAEPSSIESEVQAFLRSAFPQHRQASLEIRYAVALADLDEDGRSEAVVQLVGSPFCGSGGCTLLVLTRAGAGWRVVTRMTVTSAPIRALDSRSRGWRDLVVSVRGGGMPAREARMVFDGSGYPTNPSVVEESPEDGAPGRILISPDDALRPLF